MPGLTDHKKYAVLSCMSNAVLSLNPFAYEHVSVYVPPDADAVVHYQSILQRCHAEVSRCPKTFETCDYSLSINYIHQTILFMMRDKNDVHPDYPHDYPCIPTSVVRWIRHIVPFIIWGHPLSEVSQWLTVSSDEGPTDADTALWYDTCRIKVPSDHEGELFW